MAEISVRQSGRMSANRIPHQRPVILIGGLHDPITADVLNSTDIPKQQNDLRRGTERGIRHNLITYCTRGIVTAGFQGNETLKKSVEIRRELRMCQLDVGHREIWIERL